MKRPETLQTTTTSTFDSSKYSSAKSISSDMLFGNEQNVSTPVPRLMLISFVQKIPKYSLSFEFIPLVLSIHFVRKLQ